MLENIDNACSTSFFIHRRVALNACCFMYIIDYIYCFNRIVNFLVRMKYTKNTFVSSANVGTLLYYRPSH